MWYWLPYHLRISGCSEDTWSYKCHYIVLSYILVDRCYSNVLLNWVILLWRNVWIPPYWYLTVLKIKLSVNLNSNRAFVFQVWRTWACWPSVNLFRKHSRNYNTVSHFNMHAWHTDVLEINIKKENLLSVTKRCTLLDVSDCMVYHTYLFSCEF